MIDICTLSADTRIYVEEISAIVTEKKDSQREREKKGEGGFVSSRVRNGTESCRTRDSYHSVAAAAPCMHRESIEKYEKRLRDRIMRAVS